MSTFSFDPSLSADENIERFFGHLETTDDKLTKLLKANIEKMLPFPDTQDRSARRVSFNSAVANALDLPKDTSGADSQ